MHHNKLLYGLVLVIFLSASAENIRLLDKQEINKRAVIIEKQLVRHKYIVGVLAVLGHIQNVYFFMLLLTQSSADNAATQLSHNACAECIKKATESAAAEKISMIANMQSGIRRMPVAIKNLVTTKQGWGAIGQFILYHGALLSTSFILSRVADTLIHPDTLRWYIYAHVPYISTIADMKEVISNLQDQSLDQKDIFYNRQLLKGSLIRLARYGELICAYMTYKIKHLEEAEQEIALKTFVYLFDYYNSWLIDMNILCEADSFDYARIYALIKLYETTITSQLRHFYAIEGETKIDWRAMEEMI